jgi:uncharacterized membrane protein YjfL (UPF0719 family)
MLVTLPLFDRLSFPEVNLRRMIMDGNLSAGILDAGNLIATAIIIRSLFTWIEADWIGGVIAVLLGYVVSQILLTLITYWRIRTFRRRNDDKHFVAAIQEDNVALAVRFSGFRIGVALAISGAAGVVAYQPEFAVLSALVTWLIVSVILAVAAVVAARLIEAVVLHKIDVSREVDRERNTGVAVIEGGTYLAVGLIVLGLLS